MINSTHNSGNDGDSTGSDFSPSPPIYVLAVVVILTAVASILGNSLVQIAFWRTKSLKQSSPATLVMVLACVDLCMATFVMPFVVITALHDKWFLNHDLCVATGFINTLLTALQFGILFSISINRFSAVSNPHRYQVKWTTKITYGMISFVFGHSLLWSLMPFMGWGGYGFSPGTLYCNIDWSKHKSHSISLFAFCYIIPAIIAGILYIAVYIKTRRIGKGHAADVRENRKDLNVVNGGRDEESCSDMHGRTLTDSTFSLNMKGKICFN